jgi:hypothetical protein
VPRIGIFHLTVRGDLRLARTVDFNLRYLESVVFGNGPSGVFLPDFDGSPQPAIEPRQTMTSTAHNPQSFPLMNSFLPA